MSRIVLPESVLFNLEREQMVERHNALRWFDRQLKDIDPRLELVKASESASAPGMAPGFWHVCRRNEQTIDTYIPITTPNGEFCEPSSGWLDAFRGDDAWNNGGWDAVVKRWHAKDTARARDKENRRVARVEELAGRMKAIDSPGVSMTQAGPWRYRAGARRG